MKKAVDKLKPIYSKDYYRMEKLVSDPKFKKQVRDMLAEYKRIGAPLPPRPLTYDQYLEWLNQFWNALSKLDTFDQYELPPPGNFLENLLEEFDFNPRNQENRKFEDFLEAHVFRGQEHLHETLFEIRWIRNKETDKMELFLKIEPYTRKEHVEAFWDEIEKDQKHFPEYLGKSKEWSSFERDLYIFRTYEEIRNQMPARMKSVGKNWKVKGFRPVDFAVKLEVCEKYPNLSLSTIRKAIIRVGELDGITRTDKEPL
jgi:hypothetical protein